LDTDLLENLEPHVLSPVGCDGGEHEGLQLDVAQHNVPVHTNTGGGRHLTVAVPGTSEVVKTILQSKLEIGAKKRLVIKIKTSPALNNIPPVVLLSFTDQSVELVVKELVSKSISRAGAQRLVLDNLLNPILEGEQTQNVAVGNRLIEVGILNGVTSIGESDTGSIGTELVDRILQSKEVTSTLAHLLAIQQQVAVGTDTTRPVLLGEESDVVILQPKSAKPAKNNEAGFTNYHKCQVIRS